MSATLQLTLAALGAEIVLILLVLLTVSYVRNRSQRKRDAKAIDTLVTAVKSGQAEREKVIGAYLQDGVGLGDETRAATTAVIVQAELGLLQRFAEVYRDRDAAGAASFHTQAFSVSEPYRDLTPNVAVPEAGEGEDSESLELLRSENARLAEELSTTMESMGRMLDSYSTRFATDSPEAGAVQRGESASSDEKTDTGASAEGEHAEQDAQDDPAVAVQENAADTDAPTVDDADAAAQDDGPETGTVADSDNAPTPESDNSAADDADGEQPDVKDGATSPKTQTG